MRRVQLPETFLRASRNPSVAYACQRAFRPQGLEPLAKRSPRLVLEWCFTQRDLACRKIPVDARDRCRLVQVTIPAICAFRWPAVWMPLEGRRAISNISIQTSG